MPTLNVITRGVSKSINNCELCCYERVDVDYERTVEQHNGYVAVFEELIKDGYDINLVKLPALDTFADSMFMEDPAMMYPKCAVFTRPGAVSRRGEVDEAVEAVKKIRPENMRIQEPGTVEGGDVLFTGRYAFIGKSKRSNDSGYEQLKEYLAKFDIEVVQVPITECLHVKCAATFLDEETIILNTKLIQPEVFTSRGYKVMLCEPEELHGGNVLSFVAEKNGVPLRTLVYPKAYPKTLEKLQKFADEATANGRPTRVVVIDVSEVAKAEGDLTCLSLLCYN